MKKENLDELEALLCTCEMHELSYNFVFNQETFDLFTRYKTGSDAEIKFANKILTMIMKRSGHLRTLPLEILKLSLDIEVKYLELSIDSEF